MTRNGRRHFSPLDVSTRPSNKRLAQRMIVWIRRYLRVRLASHRSTSFLMASEVRQCFSTRSRFLR
jgi:hypothetical protein